MTRRRKRSELSQARRFAGALLVIAWAFAGLSLWRGHPTRAVVLAALGPLPALVALAAPAAWVTLFRAWMRLGERLSRVSTVVILSLFYFLVFTPISVVRRFCGGKPLDVTWKDGRESYWVEKPAPEVSLERYEKQF